MSSMLQQLPPAPPGKTGWPWTVESEPLPGSPNDWPRISIVTASFNQGKFIEETIRSILLQNYPNLEYFVMDGGSTDETVSVLKKYERWITGWVSERDGGQPDAINKGWKRCTGQVLAWLNSDDWYYPNALREVALAFKGNPSADWICGEVDNCWSVNEIAKRHHPGIPSLAEFFGRKNYGLHQPGMFWRRDLIERVGYLDTTLQYSFCHDFWARMLLQKHEMVLLQKPIAYFRLHDKSKTCSARHKFAEQDWQILERYADKLSPKEHEQAKKWLQETDADILHDTIYGFLARGKKQEAKKFLLKHLYLLPKVTPKKILPGLFFRTLVTGHAPAWFRI